MSNGIEDLIALIREIRESWEETLSLIQQVSIDWNSPHPSLGMTLEDFNKGLMTAIELSGSADQREYEKTGTMVNLTQNFKSMLDSLRIIRDNSNAVRNYLKSAKDAGQAIVAPNVNTLNNTSTNQSLNIGDHFKQIRNQSGNFVSQLVLLREFLVTGALADLSDRIQKFHELSDQIRPVLDKIKEEDKKATDLVGNMSRLLEQANSYLGNIEGVKNKSTEINSNSEAALNEINAKLAKIRETTTEAEKLRTQVDQYQSQYKAFDEELTARLNRFKEFDKANTEAQEKNSEREKEIDKITEKSNQMLRGATNAGLARAFYDASEKYGKDAEKAKKVFYLSIFILFLSVIPLAAYILPLDEIIVGVRKTDEVIKLGGVMARAILLLPAVWFTTFTSHRFWALFQLHREYSFKAAIAMSVDGFKQQAPNFEQEIAGTAFVELAGKPEYKPPKESVKTPNPIMQYLIKVIQRRFGKMSGTDGSDE